jgi:hypothetical protein
MSSTLKRAAQILDALTLRLRTQVAIEPLPPFPEAQAILMTATASTRFRRNAYSLRFSKYFVNY